MIPGYPYIARLDPTAVTIAKTLVQVKMGAAAPGFILDYRIFQVTKTTSEILRVGLLRKTAAATVTSFTPLKLGGGNDPASAAAGGTSATGNNASAEGTDGDVLDDDDWNVLNASWGAPTVPETRIFVPAAGIIGLKLFTAPAASMTLAGWIKWMEWQ